MMLFRKAAVILFSLAALAEAVSIREEAQLPRRQNNFGGNNGNNGKGGEGSGGNNNAAKASSTTNNKGGNNNAVATATCLSTNAIQTGSQSDGQNPPVDGQAASAT
jgi:hypothetical protein